MFYAYTAKVYFLILFQQLISQFSTYGARRDIGLLDFKISDLSSRDHYQQDSNLMFLPPCGFRLKVPLRF